MDWGISGRRALSLWLSAALAGCGGGADEADAGWIFDSSTSPVEAGASDSGSAGPASDGAQSGSDGAVAGGDAGSARDGQADGAQPAGDAGAARDAQAD